VNIVVCVKQVPSSEARIQIGSDGRSIDRSNLELVVNPYDEYAVEEALRTARSSGDGQRDLRWSAKAEEALRTCLALGADRALIVKDETLLGADAIGTARILAEAVRSLAPDFGPLRQGLDRCREPLDRVAVAELLGLPHAAVVSKVEWIDEKRLKANREIEGPRRSSRSSFPRC